MISPPESVDEISNPILARVAVRRTATGSGRGSPFHSLGIWMAHRAPIIIQNYSESWPELFRGERELLESVVPAHFHLEHIGSTAVPRMQAKPIIDMMLGAKSLSEIDVLVQKFASLGYEYMPQHEVNFPERRFFAKPIVRPRVFHLHCVIRGERFWTEHIDFRDLLRSNSGLAHDYSELKTHLAEKFGDDRAGYTAAKSDFINAVLRSIDG